MIKKEKEDIMIQCKKEKGYILSTKRNCESVLENEQTFLAYTKEKGKEIWGTVCKDQKQFPLIIKEIDCEKPTVQLHANGMKMWYVLECKEDACIYFGPQYTITKGDLKKRFKNNELLEILEPMEVEEGSVIHVAEGTMFALQNVRVLEISENIASSVYTMKDKMEKWVSYAKVEPVEYDYGEDGGLIEDEQAQTVVLSNNPLFIAFETTLNGKADIAIDEDSFGFIYIVDGENKDAAYFIEAGSDPITMSGNMKYVYVRM